jgi:hypothetical protein
VAKLSRRRFVGSVAAVATSAIASPSIAQGAVALPPDELVFDPADPDPLSLAPLETLELRPADSYPMLPTSSSFDSEFGFLAPGPPRFRVAETSRPSKEELLATTPVNGSWYRLSGSDRPPAVWSPPANAVDYAHLGAHGGLLMGIPPGQTGEDGFYDIEYVLRSPPKRPEDANRAYIVHDNRFDLSAELLLELAHRNAFDLSRFGPRVVFGLRGCVLTPEPPVEQTEPDWRASLKIATTCPNHRHRRCIIGVLDTETRQLCAFSASTVPEVAPMFRALGWSKSRANLMPCGLYRYRVGAHAGSHSPRQSPALRSDQDLVVLRSGEHLTYDTYDELTWWDVGLADRGQGTKVANGLGNNIHAAILDETINSGPQYSSAGCQVIRGRYTSPSNPFGQWVGFQKAAGLVNGGDVRNSEDPGKGSFGYMLLTGLEALIVFHSSYGEREYKCLRPGSSGEEVAKLQEYLGQNTVRDGQFGRRTSQALLEYYERVSGEAISPVLPVWLP